jgi:hypothetical protein
MISFKKTWRFFYKNELRERCERFEVEKDDLAPFFCISLKWWSAKSNGKEVELELDDKNTRELYLFLKDYFDNQNTLENG